MFKKILCIALVLLMTFSFAACGKKEPASENTGVLEQPVKTTVANPLTGIEDFDPAKLTARPVAVMIDNDSVAQKNAQFGVSKADIVYETEVEGGITRLMAVFADYTKIPQLGDVRSARFVYSDLANGHNAIYVHSGADDVYCRPHMKAIGLDNFEVTTNNYAWRHTYGSATNWQNLYTSGEKLTQGFADKNWKTTQTEFKSWQNFVAEAPVLAGGAANKVTVGFSGSSTSYFTYDATTGKYNKTSAIIANIDKLDSTPYAFKNVFVLKTNMGYYSNNKHRNIDLNSGTGYYIVNGTYCKIKWQKGDSNKPFTFTNEDGTPLNVAAGNSWVCIAKNDAAISFN